mgnify:CR=1 FL=1
MIINNKLFIIINLVHHEWPIAFAFFANLLPDSCHRWFATKVCMIKRHDAITTIKNACLHTLIASKDPNDKCPRQWPTDLWSWQWQWSAETYSTFWLSIIIAHIRLLIWKPYNLEHYMYTPLHKPRLIYIHMRNSSKIYLAKLSEKSSWTF